MDAHSGHSTSSDLEKVPPQTTRRSPFKRKCLLVSASIIAIIAVLAIALGVGLGVGLHNRHSSSHTHQSSSLPLASDTSIHNTTNNQPPTGTANDTKFWRPEPSTPWQIVLDNPISNFSLPYPVFDIDLFDNPPSTISTLHSQQKRAICYFSAGSFEPNRPDSNLFNHSSDLGKPLPDYPSERWVDTRSATIRAIMVSRLDLAKSKGCDGVDPDNVDAYDNNNGLNLTEDDAVSYINFLIDEAHARNLSIGLKNAGDVVSRVVDNMEWVIVEQCVQYKECGLYTPFARQNKAVLDIEYPSHAPNIAPTAVAGLCPTQKGFSGILKETKLGSWMVPCPDM